MSKKTPLHLILSEMLLEMMAKGVKRKAVHDNINDNKDTYIKSQSNDKTFALDQEIVITDITIYHELKLNAIKLLISIQMELKMNNPLWECTTKHLSETRSGISQLVNKNILIPLDNDIYIVNPEKMRRGRPLTPLIALYAYSKNKFTENKNWKISSADIKRLHLPDIQQFIELKPKNDYGYEIVDDID